MRLLTDMHQALRQAVADMPEKALRARGRGPFDNFSLVTGIAAHDRITRARFSSSSAYAANKELLKQLMADPPVRSAGPSTPWA